MGCSKDNLNTGKGCPTNYGYVLAIGFIDEEGAVPFATEADVTLANINLLIPADRPNRLFPVVAENVVFNDNEIVFETVAQGINIQTEKTAGTDEFHVKALSACEQERLMSYGKTRQKVVYFTSEGFVLGTELADGSIDGIESFVHAVMMKGSASQVSAIKLMVQNINPNDFEDRPAIVEVVGLVSKRLEGLRNADLTEVGTSTSILTVAKVLDSCRSTALNEVPILGRLLTDFLIVDLAGVIVTITSIVDNEDGTYDLIFSTIPAETYTVSLVAPKDSSDGKYETLTSYDFTIS